MAEASAQRLIGGHAPSRFSYLPAHAHHHDLRIGFGGLTAASAWVLEESTLSQPRTCRGHAVGLGATVLLKLITARSLA